MKLAWLIVILVSSCGSEPECRWSDECATNMTCNSGTCERPFFKLPGVLLKGSVTTHCVAWNSSAIGVPAQLTRVNEECQSGFESAQPCKEIPKWLYVCD